MPFFSICIPAYKRIAYLERLLQSIEIQTFKDYEIIITDDSPDDTVSVLCQQYFQLLPITYHKNQVALGTPANWNKAISLAQGDWIKLMHDDDWFTGPSSLGQFADCAREHKENFIFSAFINKYENSGKEIVSFPGYFRLNQLKKQPASILSKNIIGHPSTTLHRNDGKTLYDIRLKWLVDIEMYIRRARINKIKYIPETLVVLGMSDSQVTAQVKNDPKVEIPEHLYFLNKMGPGILKNIFAYDYFWRFIRNFNIKSEDYFKEYDKEHSTPEIIKLMVRFQNKIPRQFLKIGVISKMLMLLHYLTHQKKIS
ncbi:glycosyltransferase family 2 protein [Niabella sp. 22666]|uniref:glycosyltransferase family 2 protein n=1 Tax=Niabella sp. 22666 TaxID=3453954 RepID=UPI003F87720B